MKVRQIDPNSRQPAQAVNGKPGVTSKNADNSQEIEKLFDHKLLSGLMGSVSIDPADQQKKTSSKLATSTSLGGIPNSNSSLPSNDADAWSRQDPPSLGIPYGVDTLWARPLDVRMLSKVHAAQMTGMREGPGNAKKAFTMMLDALTPTLRDFDIRNLTVPDYYSHLYWLRLNSYPRSQFTIPWTSRYGNENVTPIRQTDFEFEELAMTKAEYNRWKEQGITFPTVRDMEVMFDDDLSEEDRWMINYAQYIYIEGEPTADWMRRKVDKFVEMGTDAISLINDFAAKATHGVVEVVTVRDANFDLDKAIEFIENEVTTYVELLNSIDSDEADADQKVGQYLAFGQYLKERSDELTMLKKVKENDGMTEQGTRFIPEKEVVKLARADVTLLFPQN